MCRCCPEGEVEDHLCLVLLLGDARHDLALLRTSADLTATDHHHGADGQAQNAKTDRPEEKPGHRTRPAGPEDDHLRFAAALAQQLGLGLGNQLGAHLDIVIVVAHPGQGTVEGLLCRLMCAVGIVGEERLVPGAEGAAPLDGGPHRPPIRLRADCPLCRRLRR